MCAYLLWKLTVVDESRIYGDFFIAYIPQHSREFVWLCRTWLNDLIGSNAWFVGKGD